MPVQGFTANGIPLLGSVDSAQRVQGLAHPPVSMTGKPWVSNVSGRALPGDLSFHRLWTKVGPFVKPPAREEREKTSPKEVDIFGDFIEIIAGEPGEYERELNNSKNESVTRQIFAINLRTHGSYVREPWYVHQPLVMYTSAASAYYATMAYWSGHEIGEWKAGEGTTISHTMLGHESGGGELLIYVAYIPEEFWPTEKEIEEKEPDEEREYTGEDWLRKLAEEHGTYIPDILRLIRKELGGWVVDDVQAIGEGNYRPRPGDLVGRGDGFYQIEGEKAWEEVDKERQVYLGNEALQEYLYGRQVIAASKQVRLLNILRAVAKKPLDEAAEDEYEDLVENSEVSQFAFNPKYLDAVTPDGLNPFAFERYTLFEYGKVFGPFSEVEVPYGGRAAALYLGVDKYSLLWPLFDPPGLLGKGEAMPTTGYLCWGFEFEKGAGPGDTDTRCELQRHGGFPGNVTAGGGRTGLVPA